MKTRQSLITAVLDKLNATAAGQNPDPEDVTFIDSKIDGKVAELNANDVLYWSLTDEFPDEVVDPLSILIASDNAPAYGQQSSPEAVAVATARLQALKPSTYVKNSPQQVEYF